MSGASFNTWKPASQSPNMTLGGDPIAHVPLVVVRVLHDNRYRFEQWDYTPEIDGPWDNFVKEHQVKLWAAAGHLLHDARLEAGV